METQAPRSSEQVSNARVNSELRGRNELRIVDNNNQASDVIMQVAPLTQPGFCYVVFGRGTQPELQWLDPAGIESVIAETESLRALIDESYAQLCEIFRGDTVTLRSSVDPDEPSSRRLVIKVKTSKDFENASELWKRFNDDWWLPNFDRADDKLCILMDFQ